MATLSLQAHCRGHEALRHVDNAVSSSASSSKRLWSCSASAVPLPIKPLALPCLRTSTFFNAGTSSFHLLCPRPSPHHSRAMKRSQPGMTGVIKAAFIIDWIENMIKFLTRTPMKLLAQKIEDDLNKAAKMIKSGASIVVEVAKEVDEFAEKFETVAEQAEEIAEKVAKATETIEERVDEVLDVIEGEKKLVITSFNVVDNDDAVAVKTTTIEQDGNTSVVTVETSSVNDSNLEKTNSP